MQEKRIILIVVQPDDNEWPEKFRRNKRPQIKYDVMVDDNLVSMLYVCVTFLILYV